MSELVDDPLDVGCPLDEQQAVPATLQRVDHVVDDLGEAGVVGDEIAVDGRPLSPREEVVWAMVWRTGPSCSVIKSSSLSRRYGVAVSPSQRRAGICLTACSNAATGMGGHSFTTTSP